MWRHSWLTRPLTITQNICPLLFESNMSHSFQTHLQQTNSQVHESCKKKRFKNGRQVDWPAACYGFWHPAETSMGLTQTFFFFKTISSSPQMSGNTKRNPFSFFFWRPGNEYDYGPLGAWEMQRPKKILHLQTTVNRRIDKSQDKFSNVTQDAWSRTISDQNVGWNSHWTNLRKLSFRFKCGRPGFRTSGGKNCWTSWCQYKRLLIKRTIILL